jgi:hypothetical protein
MTFSFDNVYVDNTSCVVGPYEKKGPIGKKFDKCYDDLYIGEIRKECKVLDDLHIFDVGVSDESVIPALINVCHKWVVGFYKPGEIFKGWNTKKYKSLMNEEIQKVRNPYYIGGR